LKSVGKTQLVSPRNAKAVVSGREVNPQSSVNFPKTTDSNLGALIMKSTQRSRLSKNQHGSCLTGGREAVETN